ncbi:EAL domain-containing protein [Leptospira ilyithenensis]|nr:EAL domain-containing protein [Leptospira ilyithenensis]
MVYIVWESSFVPIEWNREAERIFGWTRQEVIGKSMLEKMLSEDIRQLLVEQDELLFHSDKSRIITIPALTKDGRRIIFEWNITLISAKFWRKKRFITVGRDIGESLELQEQLLLCRNLVEYTKDPIIFATLPAEGHRFCFISDEGCSHFGKNREAILNSKISDFDNSLNPDTLSEIWEECKRNKSVSFESEYLSVSGEPISVENTFNYFKIGTIEYCAGYIRDMRDRKKQADQLREFEVQKAKQKNELQYQEIFEKISDLFFLFEVTENHRFRLLKFNPAAAKITGFQEEQIGKYLEEISPQESNIHSWFQSCLKSGNTVFYDDNIGLTTGSRHFQTSVTPIRDESGKIYRIIAVARDLTENRNLENSLRKSEEEFRTLAENTPDVIVRYDRNCRRVYSNPAHKKVMGFTTDGALGTTPSELWTLTNSMRPEEYQATLMKVMETATPTVIHWDWNKGNGESIHFAVHCVPEFHENELIGALAIGRDISDIRRAESSLRKKEEEFRSLVENMPDNVSRHDSEGYLIYVNPQLSKNIGMDLEPLLGMAISASVPGDSGDVFQKYKKKVMKVLETGQPDEMEMELALSKVVHHIRFVAERDSENRIVGVLAIGRDITERKSMEAIIGNREQQFRSLTENIPLGISRYDSDFRCIYINPAEEKLCRKKSEEVLGQHITDVFDISRENAFRYACQVKEVFKNGLPSKIELEWANSDGSPGSYMSEIIPEFDSHGVSSVLSITHDITLHRLQSREMELRSLIFEAIAKDKALSEVLTMIATYLGEINAASYCGIFLVDKSGLNLIPVSISNLPHTFQPAVAHLKVAEGMGASGTAAYRSESFFVEDIQTHPYWSNGRFIAEQNRIRAAWSKPILNSSGKILGVVSLYRTKTGLPGVQEKNIMKQMANFAAIAIEYKRKNKLLKLRANFDSLTSLANRYQFGEKIKSSMARSQKKGLLLGIVLIDIDNFKDINDSLGHSFGDDVLKFVSGKLKNLVGENDTVARMGGDEFALLINDVLSIEAIQPLMEKIVRSVSEPIPIQNREFNITCSAGVSFFPSDAEEEHTLLRFADSAMYKAKETGKNQYRFFTSDLNSSIQRRMNIGDRLRRSLWKSEFEVYYQPRVSMDGAIHTAEALLRWDTHSGDPISPSEFIPVAEENGTILEIGEWVIRNVCEQIKKWEYSYGSKIVVSINVSGRQFQRKDIVQNIERILNETGVSPKQIEIELTESTLMHDVESIVKKLESLKNLGIGIAVDDFGTGYSSLNYLKNFPIDYLKIDKSFISEIPQETRAKAVVETILNLASNLGLKTIAEGVETIEQVRFLRERNCHEIQGYYFSKPLPSKELETLLSMKKIYTQ